MTKQDRTPMDAEAQDVTRVEVALVTGLALLRLPFPANQISKLPKPTKAQTDKVRQDFKLGIRCDLCGAWHHKDVVHLDYVGHAALTDRLLDADPEWNWEPVSVDEKGIPVLDATGGMWIRLTVCGVTRLGYGDADGKQGGNAVKERIGDALRNAAMRFGAALDLWHKGDLHAIDAADAEAEAIEEPKQEPRFDAQAATKRIKGKLAQATTLDDLKERWTQELDTIAEVKAASADLFGGIEAAKNTRRDAIQKADMPKNPRPSDDLGGDEIPY